MKNSRYNVLFVIFTLLITVPFILSGCNRKTASKPFERTEILMGTPVTITVYNEKDAQVFDKAFARVRDIENKMSINLDRSEVIDINNASGKSYVKVSPDTFEVIKKGKYYSELSGGRFDITIGPLVKLWGIGTEAARVPAPEEIKAVLPLINYRNIMLNENDKSIMLKERGMAIDLGGIAKGYTADEIKKILIDNGVKHAIINLGGNILVIGGKPDGSPYKIGLQDPFYKTRGEQVGILTLSGKTVVTSGVYERYFEKDGKKYHHILDHITGYPVDNNLMSVSIITDVSADADALSTSVFSMGLEEGMKFVKSLKGVDAIFITKDHKVYTTEGADKVFQLTNPEFKLQK
ncbi:FAD:protein FMN transferase [Fonticella tunisiensis]|uniref:FAD:protein FMN transferase n=1 Tax=Fonticella tunisiensis TaxID=1096341 RepID=A0A4R7K4G8_9CLOT|nr:FAD:protein FMN transferase [Fonticella tunisiensis]TDT46046.1 thiamine biosynthesis lipoprotein [Fonticella tunisiensis]